MIIMTLLRRQEEKKNNNEMGKMEIRSQQAETASPIKWKQIKNIYIFYLIVITFWSRRIRVVSICNGTFDRSQQTEQSNAQK